VNEEKHFTPSTQYTNNMRNTRQLDINKNSSANNDSRESKGGEGSKRKKVGHMFKSREISMDKYKILMKPQNPQHADLDTSPYSELSPLPNHFAFNQNEGTNTETRDGSPKKSLKLMKEASN
jgi:hypothetical protein